MIPFQALYGRVPPHLVRFQITTPVDSLEELLVERDAVLDELQFNLARAQQIMKWYADKHKRQISFNIGDLIYIKLQPYRQKYLATRRNQKLAPRFYGPRKILQKIGPCLLSGTATLQSYSSHIPFVSSEGCYWFCSCLCFATSVEC